MAYTAAVSNDEDGSTKPDSIIEQAKKRWKLVQEAESGQREREREDISFQIPENQWTDKAKEQRKGRPMLSVSLLRQPMQLVQNQASAAQLGVDIHPVNENATDELAEIKQGMYRRIERDSNAEQARLWALDRAKQCGRGWYRVVTQWDEDGDDPWDQEISIERITAQESVYIDPAAQKPDFSDAEWAFVATWMPRDEFRRKYPKAKAALTSESEFRDMSEHDPEWVRVKNGKEAVLVVEYFHKAHEYETIVGPDGRKREKDNVTVKWCKLAGCEDEPIEETDWPSRYIPLIPVIGVELQPIDGERRWEGMVRPAMDAQRIFNHGLSQWVEDISRVSKVPVIAAAGQFEGFEKDWEEANVRNLPYLEYNAKIEALPNVQMPPPMPMQVDGTKMQQSHLVVQEGKNLVQSATAIYDPSLGIGNRNESGRKVLALQQQADAGTSNYVQNLAKISMRYEAMVVLDLMPKIYDRPGRITRVLGGEDDTKTVMLNQPFVIDPNTGQPMPAPVDQAGNPLDHEAKMYDLSRGKYSLSVTVGKSHQTRLQEGAEEVGKILEAAPELMPLIGPTYFRFRDFPGAKEIADLLKQVRDKANPGLGDPKDQQSPQALQAQLAAAQQAMQEMQQQIQAMGQALETDQAKQQAQMAKAEMDNAAKVQISQERNQTELLIAQMQSQQQAMLEEIRAMLKTKTEQELLALKHAREARAQHETQAHERGIQYEDHKQEHEIVREKGMLDIAKTGLQQMHSDQERHEGMAHDVGMAAGKGTSIEMSRENGQESGQERESEQSHGASRAPKPKKETNG